MYRLRFFNCAWLQISPGRWARHTAVQPLCTCGSRIVAICNHMFIDTSMYLYNAPTRAHISLYNPAKGKRFVTREQRAVPSTQVSGYTQQRTDQNNSSFLA